MGTLSRPAAPCYPRVTIGSLEGDGLVFLDNFNLGVGAFLAPGRPGGKPASLTIASSLTFLTDATCVVGLDTEVPAAATIFAHGVTIDSAQFELRDRGESAIAPGTVLMVISNTAATPIAGSFANLPNGSTFTVGLNSCQVNYADGDGNDLTLTVMP